ncbi:MAG: rRNA maturation RNase YbeY [Ruminococcaceae bacterium]|nr:rRNA maturation RNase YbeY [Oscillospiraceae bacterium]
MKIKIYWANEQKKTRVNLGLKILLTRAIAAALECEGWDQPSSVSVTFTDNEGIREKNREFRGIDAPTDVLSFPMYDMQNGDTPDPNMTAELGDIVLSLEKAYEQSVEFGHSYKRECAFLTVHSVLHLLGYDHMEPDEEEEMRARQRIIMKKIRLER